MNVFEAPITPLLLSASNHGYPDRSPVHQDCFHLVRRTRSEFTKFESGSKEEGERPDFLVKCVLLGPSAVGKSALVARYCDETFVKTYLPTIGVDFRVGEIATKCQHFKFKLQFWDTAGQETATTERFRTITLSYLRGTRSIMAVFSLENRNSLHEAVSMVRQAMGYFDESDDVLVCLVGTHADSGHQEVTEAEALAEAEKLGCSYHAVSNANGEGVPEAFHNWLDQYLEQMEPSEFWNSLGMILDMISLIRLTCVV
eukprot:s1111_g8.t1